MIQEKRISSMFVASTQHSVNKISDELIEQFTSDFERHLSETGALITQPENFFTVFHVTEYTSQNYSMELWLEVESLKESTEYIQFKTIAEGEVAAILVSENYENLKEAYDSLYAYVLVHGYKVNGDPRETYITNAESPYGYLTEIQLPFCKHTSI